MHSPPLRTVVAAEFKCGTSVDGSCLVIPSQKQAGFPLAHDRMNDAGECVRAIEGRAVAKFDASRAHVQPMLIAGEHDRGKRCVLFYPPVEYYALRARHQPASIPECIPGKVG